MTGWSLKIREAVGDKRKSSNRLKIGWKETSGSDLQLKQAWKTDLFDPATEKRFSTNLYDNDRLENLSVVPRLFAQKKRFWIHPDKESVGAVVETRRRLLVQS